ncbi:DUF6415 family natural product biosynthesis protein [Streptomyces sp. NPDC047028]|uniref:DUF6415 family natural product biosynthesis protein n=1 Tax=Streptomyces sp. NPDC047028 TaxID=3155793 RepID=UPI0033F6A228
MNAAVHSDSDTAMVDIPTMRETVAFLLGPDDDREVLPPAPAELDALTAMLRGYLALVIPEVEEKVRQLPKDSVSSYCARACIGEATRKLRVGDGDTQLIRVANARKLARSLKALCDHYERLTCEAPASEQS